MTTRAPVPTTDSPASQVASDPAPSSENPSSLFRRSGWGYLLIPLFALLAWGYVAWAERQAQEQMRTRLAERQTRSVKDFEGWLDARVAQARRWAVEPETQQLVRTHLAAPAAAQKLQEHDLHQALRARFALAQGREGLQGYWIVSAQGTNLVALDPERAGARNGLWQESDFFEQMRAHGGAVSPLIATEEELENNGPELGGQDITLYVGVPVMLDGREPAAYFIVRVPPAGLLAEQGRARFGFGGISYLVDRQGRLHADRSWLNLDLELHGLQGEPFRGRPHLFARDPGRNLLVAPAPGMARERLPLTRSAEGVSKGGAGMSLQPYRDHRGIEVVGSWTWSDRLGLGVVTEMPATEALTAVSAARQHVLIAAIVLALASVAVLLLRLNRSRSVLRTALLNAEAASRAKGVFVANMSHEIRTPLNAVLGIAHLLGATPLSQTQRDYVGMISSSGEALLNILNDILDYSKVEAGKLELSTAEFSLYDMVDTLSSIMSVNAAPKDLELVIGIESDVPTLLIGDSHRLLQVLVNLTGNAIKFTQQGEVVLHVHVEERVGDTVRLRFAVRDSGIGIPPQRLATLFSAFTQADAGVARQYGGSGLGLAICKRLVDLMGGTIGVKSEPGRGSEFWFVVPMTAVPAAEKTIAHSASSVRDVLVVDDNAIAREFVAKSVERLGWTPHEASSGDEAIDRTAHPQGNGYDVLLIDWKMPGLDGLQTGKAIRALQGVPQPPIVIMVTAFGREHVLGSPDADVVDAVVTKPTTPSKILDAVMEAHAKRRGGVAAPRDTFTPPRGVKRLAGTRMLLVEDNYINQQVARGILEAEGAAVTAVDNGQAALDTLARRGDAFDVVLMDVQMPVMDGLEATRRLRADLGLTLPVVAMSAGVTQDERQVCFDAGMDAFIAKPLEPQTTVSELRRIVQPGRTAAARRDDPARPPPPSVAAAAAPAVSPLGAVAGVDMAELRHALNGNEAAVERLLGRLAQECDVLLDTLDTALRTGNETQAASALHGFKGVAANMRASAASAHAEAVETALTRSGLPAVQEAMPALRSGIGALRDAIRAATGAG